jgi:hypothetical protein
MLCDCPGRLKNDLADPILDIMKLIPKIDDEDLGLVDEDAV